EHLLEQSDAARRLEIERHRFLVRVELAEIPGVLARFTRIAIARGFTGLRLFNLDDLGTEPGKRLRAGGSGFVLAQVHDADASETVELGSLRLDTDGPAFHWILRGEAWCRGARH